MIAIPDPRDAALARAEAADLSAEIAETKRIMEAMPVGSVARERKLLHLHALAARLDAEEAAAGKRFGEAACGRLMEAQFRALMNRPGALRSVPTLRVKEA